MNRRLPLGLAVAFVTLSVAQEPAPERPYLDAILQKNGVPTQITVNSLDRTGGAGGAPDGLLDVRDLAVYLSGLQGELPISATFGTPETLAFHSQGSVTLPIFFSKPIPSSTTIRFDLGGSASAPTPGNASPDYTLVYNQAVAERATSHQLTIQFTPWKGMGGERIIRLSLNRDPAIIPNNGTYSAHLLRVRQFEEGEFVGMLTFPPGSGLPSLAVRVGLGANGTGVCSFQQQSSLLGSQLEFPWSEGALGYPTFTKDIAVTIPGAVYGKPEGTNVNASLSIHRLSPPFDSEDEATFDAFPSNDQPGMYRAIFTIQDLIGAGARYPAGANPYAIVHQGRLVLQSVEYAAVTEP